MTTPTQFYAQFYIGSLFDPTKLVAAAGPSSFLMLDGRFPLVTQEAQAKAECRKLGYLGWSISKMEMNHPTPTEIVPLTLTPEYQAELNRIDAERYRWLREQDWHDGAACVVTHPKKNVELGSYCPTGSLLDQFVDEAMRKPAAGGTPPKSDIS